MISLIFIAILGTSASASDWTTQIRRGIEKLQKAMSSDGPNCPKCETMEITRHHHNPVFHDKCAFLQAPEFGQRNQYRNCLALFENPSIPKDMLEYGMAFFRDNFGRLQDRSCLENEYHFTLSGKRVPKVERVIGTHLGKEWRRKIGFGGLSRESLRRGIANPCQMLFNDFNHRAKVSPKESLKGRFAVNGYFIDLCADDPAEVVTVITMRRGNGFGVASWQGDRSYSDEPRTGLVSPGPFITSSTSFDYLDSVDPRFRNDYRRLQSRHKKFLESSGQKVAENPPMTSCRMAGVYQSNNDSSDRKFLHPAGFEKTSGCVGFDHRYIDKIKQLCSGKSSLVLNYGPKEFHTDTKNCKNGEPDESKRYPTPTYFSPPPVR